MKTLNTNLFVNSNEVTEDEFRELVKANNYEVYDQKGILVFLHEMNALLDKSTKEELSKKELVDLQKAQSDLNSLERKVVLTKAGMKYDRFVKYPTNNFEKKYTTYTFEEIDKKMKELRDEIKDKETRSKKRWGTPESKQLDKEILELEDELNKWKRYGHHFEKKEGEEERVEKGEENGELNKAYETLGIEKARVTKYIKRTGVPGNYQYWYKDPKTGKLVSGEKPSKVREEGRKRQLKWEEKKEKPEKKEGEPVQDYSDKVARATVERFKTIGGEWGPNKEGVALAKQFTTGKLNNKQFIDAVIRMDRGRD